MSDEPPPRITIPEAYIRTDRRLMSPVASHSPRTVEFSDIGGVPKKKWKKFVVKMFGMNVSPKWLFSDWPFFEEVKIDGQTVLVRCIPTHRDISVSNLSEINLLLKEADTAAWRKARSGESQTKIARQDHSDEFRSGVASPPLVCPPRLASRMERSSVKATRAQTPGAARVDAAGERSSRARKKALDEARARIGRL